ncbi:MAG: methylthioribulose 1-phosphate dehydratase [Gammaproteobacteria bacterium]|nr:MAG: methylthioribulose 1-phosphate dehydratase [Gammaproteobacteria bacterium]
MQWKTSEFDEKANALIGAGRQLSAQGMVPATSGNLSARLSDGNIAITVSGRHKGKLAPSDIMLVDPDGHSLDGQRPSAETLLHTRLYRRFTEIQYVLHPHSVHATVLSRLCGDWLSLQDYEILKALPDVHTHDCEVRLPVFENDQNMERLAEVVDACLDRMENPAGYLIRGHGFYTWGLSLEDALRHVEAFEFLFECELKMRELQR